MYKCLNSNSKKKKIQQDLILAHTIQFVAYCFRVNIGIFCGFKINNGDNATEINCKLYSNLTLKISVKCIVAF